MMARLRSDPHLVDGGLSILQYSDDTILFMEHDLKNARNLKLILSVFEKTFRTKNKLPQEFFFFASARHKTMLLYMLNYLAAVRDIFLLTIWVFRYTIGDSLTLNGNTSRRDYKRD
jgi:hypothetical protein